MGLRPGRGARGLSGLSAAELALALAELQGELAGAQVRDVARLADRDDLLLFLESGHARATLLIAPGGARARVGTTARRFARESFASGPLVERLRERLAGATLRGVAQPTGERRCALTFAHPDHGRLTLEIELFGNRGLWCLCDGGGRCLELSRLPDEKDRSLAPGAPYVPPRARGAPPAPEPRFAAPALAAIDAHFTAQDLAAESGAARDGVVRALAQHGKRLAHKIAGLARQQLEIAEAPALRRKADLLLAYAFQTRRGATSIEVPDPDHDGEVLRFELDPSKPVRAQIEALYERARRLEDAAEISADRQREAEVELARIRELEARVAAAGDAELAELRAELHARGLVRASAVAAAPKPAGDKLAKATHGEAFRRFMSAEGYPILAGKTNAQNDKLSLRVARGNDLWLHVGQGYAGSHVVLRVPKEKTASLESLLDAGHIAIHFSKARGATVCDVTYTLAKFVRKPKGAPAGLVTVSQNKTLRVRFEPERLARLLAGGASSE